MDIHSSVLQLIHDLNRLDVNSDTLFLIDWKSRNVVLSQVLGVNIMSSSFWVLLDNDRTSGKSLGVISSAKLQAIKSSLLTVANLKADHSLIPGKTGFEVKSYSTITYQGYLYDQWITTSSINLKINPLLKIFCWITSKDYRDLRRYLLNIKFK